MGVRIPEVLLSKLLSSASLRQVLVTSLRRTAFIVTGCDCPLSVRISLMKMSRNSQFWNKEI